MANPNPKGLASSHQMTEHDIHDYQLPGEIGVKWKDLARALGYSQAIIDTIEEEKGNLPKECCIELLVRWMREKTTDATAGRLADALTRIGLRNLADNLIYPNKPSPIKEFKEAIREMKNQLVNLKAKGSMLSARNEELERENQQLRARLELKDASKHEQEVLRMRTRSEELEEELSIARQKCRETEQQVSNMGKRIGELQGKLSTAEQKHHGTKQEVSRMGKRIEELEEKLSTAEQKHHGTEQEVSRMGKRIEELEEKLSTAEQKHHITEQEENDSSKETDQADRENRIDKKLKNINEQLRTYVTSPLQVPEVKQDQLRTPVKLDLLIRLSERLQELYTETLGIVGETCKCCEDLRRDFYDLAYHGLRAEHYDLVHRVKDLEFAREKMSEEEKEEYERLQGYQKDRQRQVERLDKLWRSLFSPPELLHKTPVSEPTGKKPSGGKKPTRHTVGDPGARPKKPKSREEVTGSDAPSISDDGKSDDESRLNRVTKMKSAVGTVIQNISQRKKESGDKQGSCVPYTLMRDS